MAAGTGVVLAPNREIICSRVKLGAVAGGAAVGVGTVFETKEDTAESRTCQTLSELKSALVKDNFLQRLFSFLVGLELPLSVRRWMSAVV